MAGSSFGTIFRITTWGESHGPALGVVVDGCPAGLALDASDIQTYLDRRRPGQSRYTTQRSESDAVEILSGVFDGITTGTPISLLIRNADQHSRDYRALEHVYRPGHADYGYDAKYGIRDHRGGGRSSGRETIGRVAAGAIAAKLLSELGIRICAYTEAIGPVTIQSYDELESTRNPLCMPDAAAAEQAGAFLETCMAEQDSAGGIIACRATGVPAGLGDPVFEKLDANLAKAILSVGAVKGVEIGDGFAAARAKGSENNDVLLPSGNSGPGTSAPPVTKETNHAGGITGGITDGADLFLRAAIKPTPSIAQTQRSVTSDGTPTELSIRGRHDPVIVPRAVVVIECMTALVLADALLCGTGARLDHLRRIWTE